MPNILRDLYSAKNLEKSYESHIKKNVIINLKNLYKFESSINNFI